MLRILLRVWLTRLLLGRIGGCLLRCDSTAIGICGVEQETEALAIIRTQRQHLAEKIL